MLKGSRPCAGTDADKNAEPPRAPRAFSSRSMPSPVRARAPGACAGPRWAPFARALGRSPQRRLRQERAERLGLERMPSRAALLDLQLVEDRLRLRLAGLQLPLRAQPAVQLVEPIVGVEDAAHDELRCDRAVPVVLLEPEGDVVATDAPVAIQARPLPERDRAAGVATVAVDTKTEVLPVAHRREIAELAARCEQRHVRVAEPERRKSTQLLAQVERELCVTRKDRVDRRRRHEVVRIEQTFRLRREGFGERLHPLGKNRQAGGGAMPAEALEELGAGAERRMQVEVLDRPPRALPQTFGPCDQDDRSVVPLDEP